MLHSRVLVGDYGDNGRGGHRGGSPLVSVSRGDTILLASYMQMSDMEVACISLVASN